MTTTSSGSNISAEHGPRLSLLLPERRRLAGQAITPAVARALGRGQSRFPFEAEGYSGPFSHYFEAGEGPWPMAALTRELDAGDAGDAQWLRADPVHVRPDLTGVRLLAYGNLALDGTEAAELVAALQPLFADDGWALSAPHPQRWYLRLPAGLELPHFAAPERVLGDDLFEHLPQGALGRRWRALLNECQVLLHQHPRNQQRTAAGLPAVNSPWFWGGGRRPARVLGHIDALESDEADLRALALCAEPSANAAGHRLVDLRDARDWARVECERVLPALAALRRGDLVGLRLHFLDGACFDVRRGDRWRMWRRALTPWA